MIADLAKVSRGTVDRVLHGRPNVNAEKRQRVEKALSELNYTPDPIARALAFKGKNVKIAVLLPNWVGFFETEVLRGINAAEERLADYNIEIITVRCETDDPEECIDLLDELLEREVRAISICARNSVLLREKLLAISHAGIPVVTFNSDIPGCGRLCFVGQDGEKDGRIAAGLMSKLLPSSCKILVVCGSLEFDAHRSRVAGFTSRFNELDRYEDIYMILESYNDYEITYQKIYEHLNFEQIDGIYMANESVAGCVAAVKQAGKAGIVKIVCHDIPDSTARFLREGSVDFAIEQSMCRHGRDSLIILAEFLVAGKVPTRDIKYQRVRIVINENMD